MKTILSEAEDPKPCCDDWKPHRWLREHYPGIQFRFCPWCGAEKAKVEPVAEEDLPTVEDIQAICRQYAKNPP